MIIPSTPASSGLKIDRQLNEALTPAPTSAKYPLTPVSVGSTTATIFEVPSNEYWAVDVIGTHNPSGSATPTVTLYYVPDGGTAATANEAYVQSYAANESVKPEALSGVVFGPGDKLQGTTGTADTVNVYGGITRFFSGV